MDATDLAATAIAATARFIAVGQDSGEDLLDWMRTNLGGEVREALARLEAEPGRGDRAAVLRIAVEDALRARPSLADQLAARLSTAVAEGPAAGVIARQALGGDRSVSAGGNISGSAIQTGDRNRATLTRTELPVAASVDIGAALAGLRELLTATGSADAPKIANALADAEVEVAKPTADKGEVASALARALGYFAKAAEFAANVHKLIPFVRDVAGWVGPEHCLPLLNAVGLSL